MGSRWDNIRARLQQVVGSSTRTLGHDWQFRYLTSGYGVEPRAYSAWYQCTALNTGGSFQELWDEGRKTWRRVETQKWRTGDTDVDPPLKNGDQLLDENGETWAVVGGPSAGPGSIAYTIERDLPLLADQDRKGGV